MAGKLNVQSFVADYRSGVKDKDLLAKHGINATQLVNVVKKLIREGIITQQQYVERNRKIQERELKEEQSFLQSLSHCEACGHIQPMPFEECPACGTPAGQSEPPPEPAAGPATESVEISTDELEVETGPPPEPKEAVQSVAEIEPPPTPPADAPPPREHMPSASVVDLRPDSGPAVSSRGAAAQVFSDELQARIGMTLEDAESLVKDLDVVLLEDYRIAEVMSDNDLLTTYRARDEGESGPDYVVKLLHPEIAPDHDITEVVDRIVYYQSGMRDPNIVPLLGTAFVDGQKAFIYPHYPLDLETVLHRYPDGVPVETLVGWMRQIFNAIGYSHMHRGKDDEVVRLPHYNLKLTRFLTDEEQQVIKTDECGIIKALFDVRGFKKHMWEESWLELGAVAPEAFVIKSRFVQGFQFDIYALGVVLYRLATNRRPFSGNDFEDYKLSHIKRFPVPPKVHNYLCPPWLDRMILMCLEKEPEDRWRSATQMELSIGKLAAPR